MTLSFRVGYWSTFTFRADRADPNVISHVMNREGTKRSVAAELEPPAGRGEDIGEKRKTMRSFVSRKEMWSQLKG